MPKLTKIQVDLLKKFIDKFELTPIEQGQPISFENAIRILEGEAPRKLSIEERKQQFISELKPYVDKYGSEMLNKFYRYWVATDGVKLKFETQKQFNIELRLANWKRNDEEYARQRYIDNLKNRL